jgi:hypothetical protein
MVFQRKNKNILNSFDSNGKDLNGNIVTSQKQNEEYKMELAWFNIIGFIYLHWAWVATGEIVQWNKTLAFCK